MSETLEKLRSALARRYLIDRELGRGGMATIYAARDLRHDREVAIKVLPPALAAAIGPERFQREIAITSRLTHPHILPLYDSGETAGALYFVMPLVMGESLRATLDRNPSGMPLDVATRIAGEICEALDYAHSRGVIHRDVTPDNILLADGHALLADFGIARLIEGESLTESGLPIGTAMYRSPEQASGHSKVEAASDIYSLGCVLYECLVGSAAKSMLSHRFTSRVPSIRKTRADIPVAVDETVARAMSIKPADRFASAGDFALSLKQRIPFRYLWRVVRIAAAVAMVITGGALGFAMFRSHETAVITHRVLVGRFVNRTGDKSLDPLSEMTSDYIARGLAETRLVEVIDSRAEGMTNPTATAVHAAASVQGSFYRVGDRLHFESSITDGKTGKLISAVEPIEGDASDGTATIERLRQRLMANFAALMGPGFEAWQAAARPPSFAGYEELLAGDVADWHLDYPTAVKHYRRAVELDPGYAGARSMLSVAASLAGQCATVDSISKWLDSQRSRVSAVDSGRIEMSYHTCHHDLDGALDAGRSVMASAPRSIGTAVLVAVTAVELFRPKEAIEVLAKVSPEEMPFTAAQRSIRASFLALAWHQLDHDKELVVVRDAQNILPDDPHLRTDELIALAALGKDDQIHSRLDDMLNGKAEYDRNLWSPAQIELCIGTELLAHGYPDLSKRMIDEASNSFEQHAPKDGTIPVDILCDFRLFAPTYYAGKWAEARAFYDGALAHDSLDFRAHEALGALAARRRDSAEMSRMDSWLANHSYEQVGRGSYSRARMAALSGNPERAMVLLKQALGEGLGFRMLLHVDPDMQQLRKRSDFPGNRQGFSQ